MQTRYEPEGLTVVRCPTLAAHRQDAHAPGDSIVGIFRARAAVLCRAIMRLIVADFHQMSDVHMLD